MTPARRTRTAGQRAPFDTQKLLRMSIHACMLVQDIRDFAASEDGWIAEEGRAIASALQVWTSIVTRLESLEAYDIALPRDVGRQAAGTIAA